MGQFLVKHGAKFLLGGAGMALFIYVAFHWQAVCRRRDQYTGQVYRTVGYSEKFIAFYKTFTPMYLILEMFVLFVVSAAALLLGFGAPLTTPSPPEEQKPLAPITTKP